MALGRNDKCRCGSGKKYKHCHWAEDQEQKLHNLTKPKETDETEPPYGLATWKLFGILSALTGIVSVVMYYLDFVRLSGAVFGCGMLCIIVYSAFRTPPAPRKKPGDGGNLNFGNKP